MSYQVVGIGEVLWDLLPSGRQMGGAPANFAYHAHALGAHAGLISRVGSDPLGQEILDRLHELGLATEGVPVDLVAPTGTVQVELSADGQPRFQITENVAWDNLHAGQDALEIVAAADAVCFGSLAQRSETSRTAIRQLVSATRPDALRVFDINLRQHYYSTDLIDASLRLSDVLKINDQELATLAPMLGLGDETRCQIVGLVERYALKLVVLTRGAHGSLLYADGRWSEHPGLAVQVRDTVGAGDAFGAAVVQGWLAGMPLDEINGWANEVAAYVCSCDGATPPLPEYLRRIEKQS